MDYDHKLNMEKSEWMAHFRLRLVELGIPVKVATEEAEYQWIHSPVGANPITHADRVAPRFGMTDL